MSCYGSTRKAFSLIEVLLVLGLLIGVAAISLPQLGSFQQRQTLTVLADEVEQALIRTRSAAMSGYGSSDWGMYVESNGYTVFSGSSYALRDTNADEYVSVQGSLSFAGSSEIVFRSPFGTSSGGTIVLQQNSGEQRTITISESGLLTSG